MSNEFDIAIVGMSGRFPGARNVDEFWQNLAEGVESITRLSDAEILESGVPAAYLSNPTYVKAAPVLEEPGHFDAAFFGFSPMEARTLDPQHRLLLELAHEALEHAGYDSGSLSGTHRRVHRRRALNTYFTNSGLNSRLAEEYIPTLIGNDKDFLSTRISYKLNLEGTEHHGSDRLLDLHGRRPSGPPEPVERRDGHGAGGGRLGAGSAPGRLLLATVAASSLRTGTCGRSMPSANGTVFGSGGGILVLKRLADALADGDTIHAVIKGSAVNNDGSEKAGYTAPSVNSQADAVVEALANAGRRGGQHQLRRGARLGNARRRSHRDPSLDEGVPHLYAAFRLLRHRIGQDQRRASRRRGGGRRHHQDRSCAQAPATAAEPPFHEANPEIDFPTTPFYVNTQLREWTSDGPRRAGVMSTGMGGTNAHVVLEEAPTAATERPKRAASSPADSVGQDGDRLSTRPPRSCGSS